MAEGRNRRGTPEGKLSARGRLERLFDAGSFHEVRSLTGTESGADDGAGVVTGWGMVDGRMVCASSEDFSVHGGSVGRFHAEKLCGILSFALRSRVPYVAVNESGGARIDEGIEGLAGYGRLFRLNVQASGKIPQIAVMMGSCAGGACYSPALCDFLFMVQGEARMFLTGPAVVKSVLFEDVSPEDLGGSTLHATQSGVAQFVYPDDGSCLDAVRALLSYLPGAGPKAPEPPVKGSVAVEVPENTKKTYDMRKVLAHVVDKDSFFEVHRDYAPNMVVGFARLEGRPVGIVASQPCRMGGAIDDKASVKTARFVRCCDAFGIPVVTLVDVPAFLPGVDMERKGIIRHGAKMLYAYAEATVPLVTVILRKAYGGAYVAMGSRTLGADLVYAWPQAEIAVLGPSGAARILHRKEIAAGADEQSFITRYEQDFCNPAQACQLGYVDAVIEPEETRAVLVSALQALSGKERGPAHGNLPL